MEIISDSNNGVLDALGLKFHDVISGQHTGIFIVNDAFNVNYANHTWKMYFNLDDGDSVLDTWVSLLDRDSKSLIAIAWQRILDHQQNDIQTPLTLENGKTYFLCLFRTISRGDLFIGFITDLTVFKKDIQNNIHQLQVRLRDKEEKFYQQSVQVRLLEWYIQRGILQVDAQSQYRSLQSSLRSLDKILEDAISSESTRKQKLENTLEKTIEDAMTFSVHGEIVMEPTNIALLTTLNDVLGKYDEHLFRDSRVSADTYVLSDLYRLTQLLTLLVTLCLSLIKPDVVTHQITSIETFENSNLVVRFSYDGVGLSREAIRFLLNNIPNEDLNIDNNANLIVFILCNLVTSFHGTLKYTFASGQGVFELTLPLREIHAPVTRQLTVLVVEDNDIVRQVQERQIRKMGHVVYSASMGKDALELFQKHAFDMLFIDIELPDMKGYELIRRIRALEESTNEHVPVPIVAISGWKEKDYQNLSIQSGANTFLTKPWKAHDFEDIILRYSKTYENDSP